MTYLLLCRGRFDGVHNPGDSSGHGGELEERVDVGNGGVGDGLERVANWAMSVDHVPEKAEERDVQTERRIHGCRGPGNNMESQKGQDEAG